MFLINSTTTIPFKLTVFVLNMLVPALITLIPIIASIAFFTLAERKVMATIQRRRGPNVVGLWGLLQPLADGLKLVIKETIIPNRAVSGGFIAAPIISFLFGILGWVFIPLHSSGLLKPYFFSNPSLSLLFLFALSSLGVYGVILGGWSSNSKYALLGSLRSAAQMISYEVSLGLTIIPVVICAGSLNLVEIIEKQGLATWYCYPLLPLVLVFLISMLAETNRAPFDLPEAEAELVAGFNVEYSGITFALFFLAEYSSMLIMGVLMVILFLGGWLSPFPPIWDYVTSCQWPAPSFALISAKLWFFLKSLFFFFMYVFVRANFPRLRYDQLMNICWKVFLPITLAYLVFVVGILHGVGGLPNNHQAIPVFKFQMLNYCDNVRLPFVSYLEYQLQAKM